MSRPSPLKIAVVTIKADSQSRSPLDDMPG